MVNRKLSRKRKINTSKRQLSKRQLSKRQTSKRQTSKRQRNKSKRNKSQRNKRKVGGGNQINPLFYGSFMGHDSGDHGDSLLLGNNVKEFIHKLKGSEQHINKYLYDLSPNQIELISKVHMYQNALNSKKTAGLDKNSRVSFIQMFTEEKEKAESNFKKSYDNETEATKRKRIQNAMDRIAAMKQMREMQERMESNRKAVTSLNRPVKLERASIQLFPKKKSEK